VVVVVVVVGNVMGVNCCVHNCCVWFGSQQQYGEIAENLRCRNFGKLQMQQQQRIGGSFASMSSSSSAHAGILPHQAFLALGSSVVERSSNRRFLGTQLSFSIAPGQLGNSGCCSGNHVVQQQQQRKMPLLPQVFSRRLQHLRPVNVCLERRRRWCVCCHGARSTESGVCEEEEKEKEEGGQLAIVWFKHDLRIDDHLGLAAALEYERVLPLFIFDPDVYAGWSKELLESLFDAVEDLRSSLRSINSDLLIWTGQTAEVLLALAHETGAASIIAEEEIEDRWCNIVVSVSTALAVQTPPYHMTRLQQWRASLYNMESVLELPDNYKEFKQMNCEILSPINPPTSLPPLPRNINPGVFLSLDELLFSVDAIYMENPWWKTLKEAKAQSAENLLLKKVQCVNGHATHVASSAQPGLKNLTRWQDMIRRAYQKRSLWKRRKKAYLRTDKKHLSYIVKGGASGATNLLSLYLKIAEPTLQKDCKGSTPLLFQSFQLFRFSNSLC
jgi:hypothetical protein